MFDCLTETETRFLFLIIGAIISGAINFFIGRNNGRNNIRYQNFLVASKEFRDTFIDMLVFLDESRDKVSLIGKMLGYNQDSAFEFIQHNIAVQEKAFVKFSGYLKGSVLDNAKSAWRAYANPNYKGNDESLSDNFRRLIAYKTTNSVEEQKIRAIIRDKINVLLSFAPVK